MIYIRYALALALLFAFSTISPGQNPTVESGFTPGISKIVGPLFADTDFQPDGKIIASGTFNVVNGYVRYNVARLNTDGTTDPTFNCPDCTFVVSKAIVQPDGKILVSGKVSLSQPAGKIIRVNADGSLDSSFNYTPGTSSFGNITVKGIQPDGKILILTSINGNNRIVRLNSDGSIDDTFTQIFVTTAGPVVDVKVLPDGRTFIFGNTTYGYLALLNTDGSKNESFESPSLTNASSSAIPSISDISLQTDGKLVIIGRFTSINGINRDGIARLNADQSVDTSFTSPPFSLAFFGGGRVFSLSNNKVLVANGQVTNPGRIFRLNSDGSLDNTFAIPTIGPILYSVNIDASERIYAFTGTLRRFNADGTLDTFFTPAIEVAGVVMALGLQSDGKILVGGVYDKANGFNRLTVSRLNADGTTDTDFDTAQKFSNNSSIFDFAVQTDGKILVGGGFTYDGTEKRLVRLNSNGSLDSAFIVTTGTNSVVNDIELLSDGKILIGGRFESVNGMSRTALARLNSDGTLDTAFNVQLGIGATVNAAIVQPDGKIMIAGNFSGVNGFNRANLARLNSDGTLDTSFNANEAGINDLLILPDGKYLALRQKTVYRFNNDGSADISFNSPTLNNGGSLTSFALLNDNSIVIGGIFSTVNGFQKNNIARLKPDGTLDSVSFLKGTDADPKVFLKQPDGKLLTGGAFKVIEQKPRTGLARLSFNPQFVVPPFDFDGDGRTDISVFRPSSNVWYQLLGPNYQFSQRNFGENGDKIVPADYDGDGKTDFAVFRPSNGNWYYVQSSNNAPRTIHWGQADDIPLPSDVNGDGADDFVVYRPSTNNWYRLTTNGQFTEIVFGTGGDKPLIGDFDGDGKADPAIYRPSNGQWWYAASSAGNAFRAVHWGIAEDIPVPQDYDGDGTTDLAVYRPSTGVWYILNSGNQSATIIQFGLSADKPVAGDYDGDGKADIAVYRPSTGEWYILKSSAGFFGLQFGISEDIPIPNAFIQ
ncbi:hypothetical protein BH20ACI4_BH20ACI4_07040 [soil metagenome]